MVKREEIAKRLKMARQEAALTQEEVAAVLGLPRPSVSQIESCRREVKTEELQKLSQLYGKPLFYFLEGQKENEPLIILMRAENVLEEDKDSLEKGLEFCKKYRELENILGLGQDLPMFFKQSPIPGKMSAAIRQGNRTAEAIRAQLELGNAPIRDLAGILEQQGINMVFEPFRDAVSGAFLYAQEIGPCIFVNANHRKTRQNFTVAHEYGHCLMDLESGAKFDLKIPGKNLIETRANAFAASFLMPEKALNRYLDEVGINHRNHKFGPYDIVKLAAFFYVSNEAVLNRLKNMDYLRDKNYEQLKGTAWDLIAKKLGLLELLDIPEEPKNFSFERLLFHKAVEAFRKGFISLGKLGEYLKLDLSEVREFVYDAGIEQEND